MRRKRIKRFRSDNGLEFMGNDLGDKLKEWGIKHETTIQYNPEQNGVAERANRTIVEKARSMLYGAKLPKHYWVQACLPNSSVPKK
jgi:transposase InsO family protein